MDSKKVRFNKNTIESLPLPVRGYDVYYDARKPGLAIRVLPGGAKTFFVYRKINGRPERVTIGRFPLITVDQARDKADEINSQFAKGEDPNLKRKALRHDITFAELFDQYLEQHAKKHKRTWQEDKNNHERYLTSFNAKPASLITKQDIERLHTKLGNDNGKYAANRVLALLSSVFNKAIGWGWQGVNPTVSVKKFKEQSRDRFLQSDELPKFFKALAKMSNEAIRDYILISLLTGARRANVLSMRWQDVNLETALWRIPFTKTGDSHTVPLVDAAIEILQARQQVAESAYVFPSKTSSMGHLVEPKKAWKNLLKAAELKDVRLHDLRRTLGSWQAATGANLSIIGKTLAHKNVSTTSIYARLNLDPVRESLNTATNAMLQYQRTIDIQ